MQDHHQQYKNDDSNMRVSAIPLTPVRTREKNVNGYSTPPPTQRSNKTMPRFEDIMNERPEHSTVGHLSMPEDHLEDILSLPIAAELRSRRSKASIATTAATDRTTSTTAFPSSSTSHNKREALLNLDYIHQDGSTSTSGHIDEEAPPSLPSKRKDSLRKRSQSSPMRVSDSPNTSEVDVSSSSYINLLHEDTSCHLPTSASSKKPRPNETNSTSVTRLNPITPSRSTSIQKERYKPSTTPSTSASARKSPNLNGQNSGPRRALKSTTAATTNRQASTPLKKAPSSSSTPLSRARSSSTSLLNNSIQHDWDENSKPPWLDENPMYLYKSDIEAIQPGSLADIARHAQNRAMNNASSPISNSTAGDRDTSMNMGDTSVRSWDDVILPAVARQIRAQQMMEMQRNISSRSGNDNRHLAQDEDLLVTEWDADGQPRKWQRLNRKKHPHHHEAEQVSPTTGKHKDLPSTEDDAWRLASNPMSGSENTREARIHLNTPPQEHHRQRQLSQINGSSSSQHLSIQQAQAQHSSTSLDSHGNSLNSDRPSHHTGRRELWDNPALRSPSTAAHNGFENKDRQGGGEAAAAAGNQYSQQRHAGTQAEHAGAMKEEKERAKEKEEAGKHSGGCCKCIIM